MRRGLPPQDLAACSTTPASNLSPHPRLEQVHRAVEAHRLELLHRYAPVYLEPPDSLDGKRRPRPERPDDRYRVSRDLTAEEFQDG